MLDIKAAFAVGLRTVLGPGMVAGQPHFAVLANALRAKGTPEQNAWQPASLRPARTRQRMYRQHGSSRAQKTLGV